MAMGGSPLCAVNRRFDDQRTTFFTVGETIDESQGFIVANICTKKNLYEDPTYGYCGARL